MVMGDKLAEILSHYFSYVCRQTGVHWDWENSGEVDGAVEALSNEIEAAIKDEVRAQLIQLGIKVMEK